MPLGRWHGPLVLVAAAGLLAAQTADPVAARIAAHIRANDLKADVSFLASDALQGRATPSPGLGIAAEYIAAQFRRAGLEPAGDDGYFQTAKYQAITANRHDLAFSLGGVVADAGSLSIYEAVEADLHAAPAFKVAVAEAAASAMPTVEQVRGKVILLAFPQSNQPGENQTVARIVSQAEKLQLAMIVMVHPESRRDTSNAQPQSREANGTASGIPMLWVGDQAIYDAVSAAKAGPMDATVTAHLAAPSVQPATVRNVIGLLPGTDPQLKDTYLIVSGHYDHLGVRNDVIYNGANDDASGTASVIAIAGALADLPAKPKRSIVFMALFGEEVDEIGSQWYTAHPVFPLRKTIADINLEQLGRTDDSEGPKLAQFNLTGFDYTDIAAVFTQASGETGVQALNRQGSGDTFFGLSDNAPFADAGIPSTTISVSYVFADYHQPGDKWQKLDYANMAKVDAAVALGILRMANRDQAPQWNRENPKTSRYVQAHDKR